MKLIAIQLAALAAALCFAAPSRAQLLPPDPAVPPADTETLYENALQSIAEGRKNDASETLMRLIEREPLHAGAYLEVALIQCSLGRAIEAERLFAVVETRFAPPASILQLIAEARATGCDSWQPLTATSMSIGRGHDVNVNQGARNPNYINQLDGGTAELPLLDDFLPKNDQYTVVAADYLRELNANGTIGFAQFQGRRNDSLHQYDNAALFAGVEIPLRKGRWVMRTTGMAGMVALGGALYQRQYQLQLRVSPPLALPANVQFNVLGGITHNQFTTLTNFDSNVVELRGQLSYRKDSFYASASAGYLDDHALAVRAGGNRRGSAFHLLARGALSERLTGELGYTRQHWDSQRAYAPGLIDEVRDQATDVLRATLSYRLNRNQSLQLEARAVRNQENISIFQYNSHQLQLNWQWREQ